MFLNLVSSISCWCSEEDEDQLDINSSLIAMEHYYCDYYKNLGDKLKCHYQRMLGNDMLNLNSNEITKAIILRLKTYYESHDEVVRFLDKRSVTPASDFFVETVLFYLKLLLEENNSKLVAKSEVRFDIEDGYIKPDISLWKDEEVVAIIECKTNLGFRRKKWEDDFNKRINGLKTAFPKAKAFLLVLSSKNWDGFDEEDSRVGKQYFALSKLSLRKIKEAPLDDVVKNRIEDLFIQILEVN